MKISIPYIVRELCSKISQTLNQEFGLPMNIKVSETKANVYFPGNGFKVVFETGTGHYGQWVAIKSITASMRFDWEADAKTWIENLQSFSGKLNWTFEENKGKLRFKVENLCLSCLEMNASNRRNDLPTYKWDDPNHPFYNDSRYNGNGTSSL